MRFLLIIKKRHSKMLLIYQFLIFFCYYIYVSSTVSDSSCSSAMSLSLSLLLYTNFSSNCKSISLMFSLIVPSSTTNELYLIQFYIFCTICTLPRFVTLPSSISAMSWNGVSMGFDPYIGVVTSSGYKWFVKPNVHRLKLANGITTRDDVDLRVAALESSSNS
jgi:hypothetical protein